MRTYVGKFATEYPQLADLVAADASMTAGGSEVIYEEHLPMHVIQSGLRSKRFLRGTIRCKREGITECYVVVHSDEENSRKSVNITGECRCLTTRGVNLNLMCGSGMLNVNRAIDGDLVALELLDASSAAIDSCMDVDEPEEGDAVTTGGASVPDANAEASYEAIEGIVAAQSSSSKSAPAPLQGKVVGIIRRNWRQYAGSIDASVKDQQVANSGDNESTPITSVQFVPVDKRIPKIWISTRRLEELSDSRMLVTIDQWPATSLYPYGHYVSVLGKNGDKGVETQVLLHEFDVPHEDFSPAVMGCLPPKEWSITEEVVAQRTDLRHIPVVSIDPPGCKDIDDALHCVRLPNGRLQAGVHIADVSYFLHPDTPMDKEAAHRSTSTYLVERRLDMLPSLLTTQLCSLRSSEDHLAFSVIWEMDDEANIYDVSFCKSAIRSVASLTYDEAQVMLDNPVALDEKNLQSRVNTSVNLLNQLAITLRRKRIEMGALTLASPEVRFKLDVETQNPTDVAMYNLKQANALVEEWMLLANITVSKQMLRFYPTLAILRRHQPPSREQFAPLLAAANAVGVSIDISSSKRLADSLDAAVRPEDPYFNKLLRILSTRCMMPAQYFCSGEIPKDQWHHYGLAAPVYTHFTSPIRRYADVLVHRLLSASIGVIALPAANTDRSKQQELCTHMNRRHRAAQYAQRASVNLHTLIYFKNKPSQETAYVLSVSSDRFSVIVPKFGIEGSLECSDILRRLGGSEVEYVNETHSLNFLKAGKKSKVLLSLQVFEKVEVSISVKEENNDKRLVIDLVHQK